MTPIAAVAAEFGVSVPSLRKICEQMDVPTPPRIYWQRKAEGLEVVQFRLLKPSPKTILSAEISPEPSKRKPSKPLPVSKQGAEPVVPERLGRVHPVVAAWVAQKKLDQEQSRLQPWSHGRSAIPGFSELERRRHRVLNALFLALEAAGFPVTEHQNRDLQVKLGGKQVSFRLREKQKRVQRPLTAYERRW